MTLEISSAVELKQRWNSLLLVMSVGDQLWWCLAVGMVKSSDLWWWARNIINHSVTVSDWTSRDLNYTAFSAKWTLPKVGFKFSNQIFYIHILPLRAVVPSALKSNLVVVLQVKISVGASKFQQPVHKPTTSGWIPLQPFTWGVSPSLKSSQD